MPEVTMPRLSDSMEEGTIIAWLKSDGEEVTVGEDIVEIETDKATMAYAAEDSGRLQIVAPVGASIPVGALIAHVGDPARHSDDGSAALPGGANATSDGAPNGNAAVSAEATPDDQDDVVRSGKLDRARDAGVGTRIKASPLARRMAQQLGVTLGSVVGSGPDGRIVKADVEQSLASATASSTRPSPAVPAAISVASDPDLSPTPIASTVPAVPERAVALGIHQEDRLEPLSRLQQTIATRMVRSRAEVPDFTVSVDVNAGPLVDLRLELKAVVGEGQPVPSINDLVIKASANALRAHPRANASYADGGIVVHARVNIGFAVAGHGALLVPVVADPDLKSVGQIARETRKLAERARDGRITPADLEGGTFTVSNLGMYGALECVPVINGSQAAILGVGAVRREPVVSEDELVIGQRLRLTVACDHRILYGADAAQLVGAIRSALEHPLSLAL